MDPLESFQHEWLRHYGDTPPLAHLLRLDDRRLWVRFHALPFSKRYAENETERLEILKRANTLGTEILGSGTSCWLVECRIETATATSGTTLRYPQPEEDFHWIATAKATKWESAAFDELLNKVAEDSTGPTLWMSRANGALFAPYDGGFDIFPASPAEVRRLRQQHADWLLSHPTGL